MGELEIGFDECMHRVTESLMCTYATVTTGRGDTGRKAIYRSRGPDAGARRFLSLLLAQQDERSFGAKISVYEDAIAKFDINNIWLLPEKCQIVSMGESKLWVQDIDQNGLLIEFPDADAKANLASLLGHLDLPSRTSKQPDPKPWKLAYEALPTPVAPIPIPTKTKKRKPALQSVFDLFVHHRMYGTRSDLELLQEIGMGVDGDLSRDSAHVYFSMEDIKYTEQEFEKIVEFLESRRRKALGIEVPAPEPASPSTLPVINVAGGTRPPDSAMGTGTETIDSIDFDVRAMMQSFTSQQLQLELEQDADQSPNETSDAGTPLDTETRRKWKRGTQRETLIVEGVAQIGAGAVTAKRVSRRSTTVTSKIRSSAKRHSTRVSKTDDVHRHAEAISPPDSPEASDAGGDSRRKWKRGTQRQTLLTEGLAQMTTVKRNSKPRRSTEKLSGRSRSPSQSPPQSPPESPKKLKPSDSGFGSGEAKPTKKKTSRRVRVSQVVDGEPTGAEIQHDSTLSDDASAPSNPETSTPR